MGRNGPERDTQSYVPPDLSLSRSRDRHADAINQANTAPPSANVTPMRIWTQAGGWSAKATRKTKITMPVMAAPPTAQPTSQLEASQPWELFPKRGGCGLNRHPREIGLPSHIIPLWP